MVRGRRSGGADLACSSKGSEGGLSLASHEPSRFLRRIQIAEIYTCSLSHLLCHDTHLQLSPKPAATANLGDAPAARR